MAAETAPDVTVVVIGYNDAARLPRAVDSVLNQSLRNLEVIIVDDASTDSSPEVARDLAARYPDRVRTILMTENSGGCGEPRNQGIEAARGTYVMFLDSDDILDRQACRNMLLAAEDTDADIVSGVCSRIYLDRNNKVVKWYPWLYEHRRVITSVREVPDLFVWDTLSTNKCYRRSFLLDSGLRYPKGILYEDLLFVSQAYLAANRVTLIPHVVYYWNVRDHAVNRSLTNRRDEISNVRDRMEIHRRIDVAMREAGASDLKLYKDVKFLKHDLPLYLRELPFRDAEYRAAFVATVAPYLDTLDPQAFRRTQPIQAIAAELLRRDDEALPDAVDQIMTMRSVNSPLAERDGRVYWTDRYLDGPEGARFDVTELGYHSKPLRELTLGNRLTVFEMTPTQVVLAGEIANPLGRIGADAKLSGQLELRCTRLRGRAFRVSATEVTHGDRWISWRAVIDMRSRVRPIGLVDPVWELLFTLRVNDESTVSRPQATQVAVPDAATRTRPKLTRMAGDSFVPLVNAKGELTFRLVGRGPAARATNMVARRVAHSTTGRRLVSRAKTTGRAFREQPESLAPFYRAMCRLPMRRGTVVFESHMGKQYSDNPKYIYEEIVRRGLPLRAVWVYDKSTDGFPRGVRLVRRGSLGHCLALARAQYWVDNQGQPDWVTKPRRVTYLETWHGSALKHMGFDKPELHGYTQARRRAIERTAERYDYFVARSEHDIRTLVRAFRVTGQPLRTGYPRNDELVTRGTGISDELNALREKLGLDGRRVVLYAPTFREDDAGKVARFELAFDVDRFIEQFGATHQLLVRTHYLNSVVLPPAIRHTVRDVSHHPDVTQLMLLSDVLVTDYSSMMFDYALLDRPMVFYCYDLNEYLDQRGAYFDLATEGPGPVVRTEQQLFEALRGLDAGEATYAQRRTRFVERYGEYDHGTAAKEIVEQVFVATGGDQARRDRNPS